MLSDSRQHFTNDSTDPEKSILTICRQLIFDSGLSVPEFTNSIKFIAEKGYIWHVVIFDENLRSKMTELIASEEYSDALEKLKDSDTEDTSNKLKKATAEQLRQTLPHGFELDQEDIDKDFIKLSEVFKDGVNLLSNMRPDEIGLVFLMPFRDINTLFNKMNAGEVFDQIKDDGFWYDQTKFEFHIDQDVIPTSYQNKSNLEHLVLSTFFNQPSTTKVSYEYMVGFDESKGTEAYRDSMRKFIKKHPKLPYIFSVHEYETEFHPERYSQIP